MSKDIEKMDKRIEEIQKENVNLYNQWKQAGETITQQQNLQTQLVAKINQNAGKMDEINRWKAAFVAKEDGNKVDKTK